MFLHYKKHGFTNFLNLLNSNEPHACFSSFTINFTIEYLQFKEKLFIFIHFNYTKKGPLRINVYRKSTHTDRYLYYKSHHDKQHKVSMAQILLHRAATSNNTDEGQGRSEPRQLKISK